MVRMGYVHRIVIDVNGTNITIERDEEGNYRAIDYSQEMHDNKVDIGLVEVIVVCWKALKHPLCS